MGVYAGLYSGEPRPVEDRGVRDGDLYFVLTGMDAVYRATFDERSGEWDSSPHWTFPGSSGNENHLNSIDLVDGELCVSGFGRMQGDMWADAKGGFVYNVDREEYVSTDIYHPHSLLEDSGEMWVVESPRRRVRSDREEEYEFPPGYIRGLALGDGRVYVGSSRFRAVSESTGRPNEREYKGVSCVYRIDRETGESEVLVDFSEERNEIFELLLL